MNKPLNPKDTPTELIEDLHAYGRIFETTMEGMAIKHNMDISAITRLFNKAALEVTDRYITLTPTPPFPLIREKHQPESIKFLVEKDIMNEETAIDTRVLKEKTPPPAETELTPSIPIVFDLDEPDLMELQPTPDIFEQPTPTHAEDSAYHALIALSVPHPDFSTGPLPEYIQYDHNLDPSPHNPVHQKVIFSIPQNNRNTETPRAWTISEAVNLLGDFEFEPSTPYPKTPHYIEKGYKYSPTPSPQFQNHHIELDWSDLGFDTEEK